MLELPGRIVAKPGQRGMQDAGHESMAHLLDERALVLVEPCPPDEPVKLGDSAGLCLLGQGLHRGNGLPCPKPGNEVQLGIVEETFKPPSQAIPLRVHGTVCKVVDAHVPDRQSLPDPALEGGGRGEVHDRRGTPDELLDRAGSRVPGSPDRQDCGVKRDEVRT
jgi:hypothetical protein